MANSGPLKLYRTLKLYLSGHPTFVNVSVVPSDFETNESSALFKLPDHDGELIQIILEVGFYLP